MDDKVINVSDNVKLSDNADTENVRRAPITGVIRIYDKDGNLVREKHNMIVNGGRYLLYGLFLRYALYDDLKPGTDDAKIADLKSRLPSINISGLTNGEADRNISQFTSGLMSVHFGYTPDTVKTISTMNIDDVNEITDDGRTFTLDLNDSDSGVDVDFDVYELKVTFKSVITGNDSFQKFNQIYLTYNLPAIEGEQTRQSFLFSRVIMDPVFLGADGEYSIYYSLYF